MTTATKLFPTDNPGPEQLRLAEALYAHEVERRAALEIAALEAQAHHVEACTYLAQYHHLLEMLLQATEAGEHDKVREQLQVLAERRRALKTRKTVH